MADISATWGTVKAFNVAYIILLYVDRLARGTTKPFIKGECVMQIMLKTFTNIFFSCHTAQGKRVPLFVLPFHRESDCTNSGTMCHYVDESVESEDKPSCLRTTAELVCGRISYFKST